MLILGHGDVLAALSPEDCADAMAHVLAAHARGEALMPLRSVVPFEGAAGFMGLMPAWRGGTDPVFGLKALCVMPGNPARGLDSHQGTVTLFDGATGVPTAVLDASAVTSVRTAAVSAVATRLLAREDARVLAILGAGVQGRAHLRALAPIREFAEVRVYAPSVGHARALADGRAVVASSAEEAVRGADVVVLATSSRDPVVSREWFAPGAHINAVGASMPSARELDVETVAASVLFCDSRESLRNEAGEYRLAVEQGAIAAGDDVAAELGEVLAGIAPGRRSQDQLTVFRSLGLAVEDLAAAERAVERARELGIGTEVAL
ncbi:MAG TPA: ornithine cyclodeaminase family protein [Solirubrobacteraceae bacterium]|nr:ornithine cyclodeaminase family protein [Solirubrobacteraceae bacterium]